jgi:hypothetical protein
MISVKVMDVADLMRKVAAIREPEAREVKVDLAVVALSQPSGRVSENQELPSSNELHRDPRLDFKRKICGFW